MEKKYELMDETVEIHGAELHRIRALKSFRDVKKGDLGGFVEKESNLSQDGNAWVYDNAIVGEDACVRDDSYVCDNAEVRDHACICDKAAVVNNPYIGGNAVVSGNAWVGGRACLFGNANVKDHAYVYNDACVSDDAVVSGCSHICGNAKIKYDAVVSGYVAVNSRAIVSKNALVSRPNDVMVIGRIGQLGDYVTFYKNNIGGISVECVFFNGTIEEFEKAVKEKHGGTFYEKQYMLAIELAKSSILREENIDYNQMCCVLPERLNMALLSTFGKTKR